MDKKIFSDNKNKIFFTLLGMLVVLACAFLVLRTLGSRGTIPPATSNNLAPNPNIVLPPQNPYTFSTSSPLVITSMTQKVAGMGTLVTYRGTLPAVGSCESMSVQTPTYGKNPVHFAFIITTAATSSCADKQKPLMFTTGFGEDSKGNSPVLSGVYLNGNKVIYTLNGN